MDQLEDYKSLNSVEQLFKEDKLEEVKELEMRFPARFSEIAACYGARRCLEFMLESEEWPGFSGSSISPRVNLYLIKLPVEKRMPLINSIHHPEELYQILLHGRLELLSGYELPPIAIAFVALLRFLRKRGFDMTDYAKIIYKLYPAEEWQAFIARRNPTAITLLLLLRKDYFLKGVRVSSRVIEEVLKCAPEKLGRLKELCITPGVCSAHNFDVLGAMRSHGLNARIWKKRIHLR